MIPAATSICKLVALLHFVSPALPIGFFSYSQAWEAAVDAELVRDAETRIIDARNGTHRCVSASVD